MTRSTLDTGICNSHASEPALLVDCDACDGSGRKGYENPRIAGGSTPCPKCKGRKKISIEPAPSPFPEPLGERGLVICWGCNRWTDPTVCACGEGIADGRMHDNHAPVPMGCDCKRDVR